MAVQVPRYAPGQTSPASGDLPLQDGQVSPVAFGASVGQELQRFGGVAGQVGAELHQNAVALQETINQADTDRTVSDFGRAKTMMLNGDGSGSADDTNAFYNLRGRPAHDALIPTMQKYDTLRDQYRTQLANPRQQQLFDTATRRMMLLDQEGMGRHAASQLKEDLRTGAQGMFTSYVMQAGAAKTYEEFQNVAQHMVETAQTQAMNLGLTNPEALKAFTLVQVSKASAAYVGAVQVHQPMQALDLLEQLHDEGYMDPADYERLGDMLRRRTDPIIAEQRVDEYLGSLPAGLSPKQLLGREGELGKRLQHDMSMTDEQRRLALNYFRGRVQSDYYMALGNLNDNYQAAIAGVMDRGDGHAPMSMTEYMQNPPANTAFNALPPEQQYNIKRMVIKNNSLAHPMTPELEMRQAALAREANLYPDRFLQHDMGTLAAKENWPNQMLGKMLGVQTSVIKKMDTTIPIHAERIMHLPPVEALMAKSDLVKDEDGNFDRDKVGAFYSQLYYHIASYEAVYHKPPTDDHTIGVAREILAGGRLHPEITNTVIKGVPDTAVIQIRDYLRTKGVYAPSSGLIARMYHGAAKGAQ